MFPAQDEFLLHSEPRLIASLAVRRGEPVVVAHPGLSLYLEEVERSLGQMWQEGTVQRLVPADSQVQIYLLPIDHQLGLLVALDLRPLVGHLQRYQESLKQAYRDLCYAATGGRLMLIDPDEIREQLGAPVAEQRHPIEAATDVGACRQIVLAQLETDGWPIGRRMEMALAVSEVVTNALVHGGGGHFRWIRTDQGWTALVADRGSGLDLSWLPHSLLLRGFSTKPSLGLGFKAVLRCVDRLAVAISANGLTVLLHRGSDQNREEG
jgi:anti-sigma regulatory factor (Ser/Thr protein kinase)